MATIVPRERHPALDISETERIDYLIAVASMAAADHDISADEIARLEKMCRALQLPPAGTQQVVDAARSPDQVAIDDIVDRLRASDLRYALLVDAIAIAYVDGTVNPVETDEILALAGKLDVPRAQAILVRRYVEDRRKRGGKAPSDARTTAKLVGAGIPVAALAISATAGAPLAASVGLACALGVSSYMSVKWLFRRPGRRRRSRGRKQRKRGEGKRSGEQRVDR